LGRRLRRQHAPRALLLAFGCSPKAAEHRAEVVSDASSPATAASPVGTNEVAHAKVFKFEDEWVTFVEKPNPDLGAVSFEPGEALPQDAPAACVAMYQRYGKKQKGLGDFSCAVAPSGEVWASVTTVGPLPADAQKMPTRGEWRLVVQIEAKLLEGPLQRFGITLGEGGRNAVSLFGRAALHRAPAAFRHEKAPAAANSARGARIRRSCSRCLLAGPAEAYTPSRAWPSRSVRFEW